MSSFWKSVMGTRPLPAVAGAVAGGAGVGAPLAAAAGLASSFGPDKAAISAGSSLRKSGFGSGSFAPALTWPLAALHGWSWTLPDSPSIAHADWAASGMEGAMRTERARQ